MTPSPFRTKKFVDLKAKWDKKLLDSGFEDIEKENGHLKDQESPAFRGKYNGTTFAEKESYYTSKQEYYRLAGQFFYDHKFETEFEKKLWSFHMEGTSIREIVKLLSKSRVKVSRWQVHTTIQKLVKCMLDRGKK